ncbi:mechanosensitive ion channel family protein [Azospirillum sp. TSO22-1]|uniref:mechanosensitive ion channel family protein n=1 Tax=Azospirillum sp. TSO22-1 TaxID=716789 RepID=UPI001FFEBC40|nr:mechanosensitive ion channel family protein [Azospirillum sp. TSO22-1]
MPPPLSPSRHLLPPAVVVVALTAAAMHRAWLHERVAALLGDGAADSAGLAIGIAAWLAAAWLGSRVLDVVVDRPTRAGRPRAIPRLLADLLRALIYGAALFAILGSVLDQPVTGLLATSGVLIAVLGFALRNMIADIFSGIALNIERPYRIGDWIELAPGVAGQVDEINWRATRLITTEGTAVIVPNGVAAGSRFVNFSRPGTGFRAAVPITLDEEVPVARAKRVLLSALVCADGVLAEPRPDVLVESIGANGIVYQARFWVADYGRLSACRDAVASTILQHLGRAGIELAHPKQDVRAHRPQPRTRVPGTLRRSLMRQLELFSAFRDEEIEELAQALNRLELPAGTVAVRQGEAGSSLFIVAEGVLDVRMQSDGQQEGRASLLDRMRPGDVFGEMSLLTGQPRSASVVANTDAVVYELDKDHLDPVLRRRPELATQLAELMAQRQSRNSLQRQAEGAAGLAPAVAAPHDLLARLRGFFKL